MSISKKRLGELEAIKDEDIDYSDTPEINENFWRRAERHMPTPKKGVFIRLDADVLDWLKSKGKGCQTGMNAMLRVDGERPARALRTAVNSLSPVSIGQFANGSSLRVISGLRWF